VSAALPPALAAEDRAALEAGIEQFNHGLFYECHDTLEEVWSGLRGPGRGFVQGLIQVAVGFYHLGNGNRAGARALLRRALGRLEGYPDGYAGVALAPLREAVGEWLVALESGAPLPERPPRIEASGGGAA
jgi:predicted metal-dependent hydrolase